MSLVNKWIFKASLISGALFWWLVGAIFGAGVVATLVGILILIMVLFTMGIDDTLIKIGG